MNRDTTIFKRLKQKYAYLQEKGYEVLYLALQGSQNYGLDINDDNYQSDIDCYAVILPTFNDFINSNHLLSTTLVLENNEHIVVKDIRSMFQQYEKQNVQFLETLFTDYRIVNKKYKQYANRIFAMKYEIANISKDLLYKGIFGMASQKYNALCEIYPSTQAKIEKYGYDGKQLCHIIRLYYFLRSYEAGYNFKQCLTLFNDTEKQLMLDAKYNNKFSLDEAKQLADKYYGEINNVYIIKHVEIPTCIVECGFLSNEQEEKELQTEDLFVANSKR